MEIISSVTTNNWIDILEFPPAENYIPSRDRSAVPRAAVIMSTPDRRQQRGVPASLPVPRRGAAPRCVKPDDREGRPRPCRSCGRRSVGKRMGREAPGGAVGQAGLCEAE